MKIGDKDISELEDKVLILNYNSCLAAEAKRQAASNNEKFNRNNNKNVGSLPDANSNFTELKNALLEEINKRKLNEWK